MSMRSDYRWQQFFAACAFLFAAFTFVGLEVFWPQPPSFSLTAQQTAAFYVAHEDGFRIGITLCTVGMAFLLAWTVQFGLMLWRLEGGSHVVSAVTIATLAASPILLSFDLAVFGIAAFRPEDTSPDVTRALSDLAWLGSQLIWPMLALGMAVSGLLIIRTQGKPGSFPAWLGYFGLVCAVAELGQAGIIFDKSGPFAGDGALSWYLATFTWGPWILAAGWVMYRMLAREATQLPTGAIDDVDPAGLVAAR
jgi:hypothetical protein